MYLTLLGFGTAQAALPASVTNALSNYKSTEYSACDGAMLLSPKFYTGVLNYQIPAALFSTNTFISNLFFAESIKGDFIDPKLEIGGLYRQIYSSNSEVFYVYYDARNFLKTSVCFAIHPR